MKIQYLKNNEIDIELWDDCVNQSQEGFPYAYSFYLNIVAPGFEAIVLNNYDAILPLPIKQKYGIQYVYFPLFCQQLGIISKTKLNDTTVAAIVNAIPSKIKYINYCVTNVLGDKGNFIPKDNYIISLKPAYPQLLANYKYNTRRQITLALKSIPLIVSNINVNAILKLTQQTIDPNKSILSKNDYVRLKKLLDVLSAKKIGKAIGLFDNQNELSAVVYYLKTEKRIINLLNASTPAAKKKRWMVVLINHIIKEHSNTNYIFDFEGSNIPSVAKFFRNFGSEKTVYYNWQWNRLPFPLKYFK